MAGIGAIQKCEPEQVITAVKEAGGNVALACHNLGISRGTMYVYMRKYPEIKEILDNAREQTIDQVEHVLIDKALEGEAWAVKFYLMTQAKHRGYTERIDTTRTTINIDYNKLTEEQLRRLVEGESVESVVTIEGEFREAD